MPNSHPLRRRFGLQLALGLALVLVAILLLKRNRRDISNDGLSAVASNEVAERSAPGLSRSIDAPAPVSPSGAAQRVPARTEAPSPSPPSPDSIDVLVVDLAGQPLAGIDVGIIGSEPRDPPLTILAATSAEDGRASFARRIVDEQRARAVAHATPVTLAVGVVPPLDGWPRVELPDPLDPGATLRLVLPAEIRELFQPLQVRVVDATGTPLAGVPVALFSRLAHDRGSRFALGQAETRAPAGIAELSLAALRESLSYSGFFGEARYQVEIALPLRERPEVDLGARPTSREPVTLVLSGTGSLAARVLDPAGEPLDGVRVGLSVRALAGSEHEWGSYSFADTEHGVASFPWIDMGLELLLRASAEGAWCERELPGPATPGEVVEATLQLMPVHVDPIAAVDPPPSAESGTTLVEVALPEMRVVRGEIRDEAGAVLAGARIALALGADGAGIQALAVSREDGRFAVGLRSEPGPALLRVEKEGYLDCVREVELGATQVAVRLERAACFEARVLLEPGFPSIELSFVLDGAALPPLLRPLRRCDVAPGEHAFEVRTSLSNRLLERIEGIRLAPGENAIDPRLDPLDLRGRWVVSAWRLVASDGAPIVGTVRVRIEGLGETPEVTRDDGRLVLVVPPGAAIELEPEGFTPRSVYPAQDEQELAFAASE